MAKLDKGGGVRRFFKNPFLNDEGVWRTALATPGLLNILNLIIKIRPLG